MVTLIFIRGLCGYVWVNILTLFITPDDGEEGGDVCQCVWLYLSVCAGVRERRYRKWVMLIASEWILYFMI